LSGSFDAHGLDPNACCLRAVLWSMSKVVWCDRIAQKTWELGQASILDPSVLPSERWAVYSRHPTYHKLTGKFDNGIYSTLGYTDLQEYLHRKHRLSPAILDKVNVHALQGFLSSLKLHKRASIVKMIHNWIPTYSMLSRHGRESSPLCPRCSSAIKTSEHVYQCPQAQAISNHRSFLENFLSHLLSLKTPIYILCTMEYKLSIALDIPFLPKFHNQEEIPSDTKPLLMTAIRHQNIIGWDNFIWGYTSIYWVYIFQHSHSHDIVHTSQTWDRSLVQHSVTLLQKIWKDRNVHLHGSSKAETAQTLRVRVVYQVRQVYAHPPNLHKRFSVIQRIPLHDRLGEAPQIYKMAVQNSSSALRIPTYSIPSKIGPIILNQCISPRKYLDY
jgi:hypothetical protein